MGFKWIPLPSARCGWDSINLISAITITSTPAPKQARILYIIKWLENFSTQSIIILELASTHKTWSTHLSHGIFLCKPSNCSINYPWFAQEPSWWYLKNGKELGHKCYTYFKYTSNCEVYCTSTVLLKRFIQPPQILKGSEILPDADKQRQDVHIAGCLVHSATFTYLH